MILHESHLPADDSHVISYLIFVKKLGKMSQNVSSAVFVIGALSVKVTEICAHIHRLVPVFIVYVFFLKIPFFFFILCMLCFFFFFFFFFFCRLLTFLKINFFEKFF